MKCRNFRNGDENIIKDICLNCGDENIKKEYSYFGVAKYRAGQKFFCHIFGDNEAFFAGIKNKSHFRILFLVLKQLVQGQGLGTKILSYEAACARKLGIRNFTFRTNMNGKAQFFWRSLGAKIIGRTNNDWEMILKI